MTILLITLLTLWLLLTTLTDIENNLMGKIIPLTLVVWGILYVVKAMGWMSTLLQGLNYILK